MMNTETAATLTVMLMHLNPQASLNDVLNIVEYVESLIPETTSVPIPPERPLKTGDFTVDNERERDWGLSAIFHEHYTPLLEQVVALLIADKKIVAIKEVRVTLNIGLKAAKEVVESYAVEQAVNVRRPF